MKSNFREVSFSTHAHIKNIIGKELINDDNVAVMELVKNSYDAGATKVIIKSLLVKLRFLIILSFSSFELYSA